ncbi:hypothetical protein Fmac_008077 [Flemingia macrophylla]|uniref:PA domain-containing protein n=1 Tax=Flemingia macrophylla TaxID=520843 RepID=A0ABD1MWD2_9FABA
MKIHSQSESFPLGCYFALNIWNAKQAGAATVLVIDNIDEALITMDFPDECDDDRLVADGFMKNISIPSALIEKTLGDMLKEA